MNWIKSHPLKLALILLGVFLLAAYLANTTLLRVAQLGLVLLAVAAGGLGLVWRLVLWAAAAWAIGFSVAPASFDWLWSWLPKGTQRANFSVSTDGDTL